MFLFFRLVLFVLLSAGLYGQQLMRTFSEPNSTGKGTFGHSIANAGDVNGDGYEDLLTVSYHDDYKSWAYLYLGGANPDDKYDAVLFSEYASEGFTSIAGAGDLNGDGYDDIIIAAFDTAGTVYIYFGGKQFDNEPDLVLKEQDGYLLREAASAGDFNNDGFNDVMVSGHGDVVYVYLGGSSMDTEADIVFAAGEDYEKFGFSIENAGDVNNDGYDDLIINAVPRNYKGSAALIYLGGSQPNTAPAAVLKVYFDHLFYTAEGMPAGDFNNDGYNDIIVGAPAYNSAYIYYGGENIDDSADVLLTRNDYGFGRSAVTVGDVNNDGFDDVMVSHSGGKSLDVYIYYGSAAPDTSAGAAVNLPGYHFSMTGSLSAGTDFNNDGVKDLCFGVPYHNSQLGGIYFYYGGSALSTGPDYVIEAEGIENNFGSRLGAGDFNNDGFDDIMISASGSRRVYFYMGGMYADNVYDLDIAGGHGAVPAGDINGDGYDDVVIPDLSAGFNIYLGSDAPDILPDAVIEARGTGLITAAAGDVNNDGYDDFAASSYRINDSAVVVIYMGNKTAEAKPEVLLKIYPVQSSMYDDIVSCGDLNNDGYDDVMISQPFYKSNYGRVFICMGGDTLLGKADFILQGNQKAGSFFGMKIAPAGDFNNDGYDDIAVQESDIRIDYDFPGRVFVYFGGAVFDTIPDLIIEDEYFGFSSAAPAGDVNNDGYDDLLISAFTYGGRAGKVMLYLGNDVMDKEPDFEVIADKEAVFLGMVMAPAGDFNNDGYADFMAAAQYPPNGRVYLYTDSRAVLPVTAAETGSGSLWFVLDQNFPNPFNPVTNISYSLPSAGSIKLTVYDILGNEAAVLRDGYADAGRHTAQWNAAGFSSGVYFYVLISAGGYREAKKLILLK